MFFRASNRLFAQFRANNMTRSLSSSVTALSNFDRTSTTGSVSPPFPSLEATLVSTSCMTGHSVALPTRSGGELRISAQSRNAMKASARFNRPITASNEAALCGSVEPPSVRWRRKFGQLAKVGSTSMKDGLYDWEAEAVHG